MPFQQGGPPRTCQCQPREASDACGSRGAHSNPKLRLGASRTGAELSAAGARERRLGGRLAARRKWSAPRPRPIVLVPSWEDGARWFGVVVTCRVGCGGPCFLPCLGTMGGGGWYQGEGGVIGDGEGPVVVGFFRWIYWVEWFSAASRGRVWVSRRKDGWAGSP